MEDQEKIEIINSKATENVEYIKIMKSETLKGIKYNWDFKILTTDVNKALELNNKLTQAFSNQNGD